MSLTEQITRRAAEAGGRLRVRSALNPVLWLCAIVVVPALGLAVFVVDPPWWLVGLLALAVVVPIMLVMFGFVYLMLFDRDKLQSEEYQIRKLSLEYMQEKGRLSEDEHRLTEQTSNPDGSQLVRNGERQ